MAGRQRVVIHHEVLEAARVRIAAGEAYHIVAKDVGVAPMTLRRRLDPSYDRRCRDVYESGRGDPVYAARELDPVVVEEAARAAAERDQLYDVSLTASLLGDPPLSRSALYRRARPSAPATGADE